MVGVAGLGHDWRLKSGNADFSGSEPQKGRIGSSPGRAVYAGATLLSSTAQGFLFWLRRSDQCAAVAPIRGNPGRPLKSAFPPLGPRDASPVRAASGTFFVFNDTATTERIPCPTSSGSRTS